MIVCVCIDVSSLQLSPPRDMAPLVEAYVCIGAGAALEPAEPAESAPPAASWLDHGYKPTVLATHPASRALPKGGALAAASFCLPSSLRIRYDRLGGSRSLPFSAPAASPCNAGLLLVKQHSRMLLTTLKFTNVCSQGQDCDTCCINSIYLGEDDAHEHKNL